MAGAISLKVDLKAVRDGFVVEVVANFEAATTIAILGPNGAGKTTLLHALAGLFPLERGRVESNDIIWEDVEQGIRLDPQERNLGFVFQDRRLFPHMTALDNVSFGARARGSTRATARARAEAALAAIGASDLKDKKPKELSGGQAQLVALARALAAEPEVLMLDEPFAALDVDNRTQAQQVVRDALDAFSGVKLLVTHDPVDARALADRILVLEGGRVTQDGAPEQVRV